MWKFFNTKSKYVIWDGVTKQKFAEDSISSDCMVMFNNELESVKRVRDLVISNGGVPTIIFACKKGQSAHEIEINGKWQGAFTYNYNLILGIQKLTFKNAIKKINSLLKASVKDQICEIICREDILDMKMNLEGIKGVKHFLMVIDMCR